jgi:phenylacetate-CoA ligase
MTTATALFRLLLQTRYQAPKREQLVNERIRRVLIAAMTVPHYGAQMRKAGYDPRRDYRGPQDLSLFAITNKANLKADPLAFVQESEAGRRSAFFSDRTSGSTGMPLIVYRAPNERAVQVAKWLRVLVQNGYRPTDKVFSFTSPSRLTEGRSVLQHFGFFRRLAMDYTLPTAKLVDALLAYAPQVIYGVRTSLVLAAEELLRRGLTAPPVKLLVAGGEVVDAHARELCRRAFGTDISETYGTVEMGVMAYQDHDRLGHKLIEDCTYFEFLDEKNRPVGPGQLGRVVVTDLHGGLMPFVRYDQGDLAVYSLQRNKWGETVRMIDRIVGRQDELARLPDGSFLTYLDFYELMDVYPGVERFRVRQQTPNEFVVDLVANPDYFRGLERELRSRLSALSPLPLHFDIRLVDKIAPDAGGKLRMLVSEVNR